MAVVQDRDGVDVADRPRSPFCAIHRCAAIDASTVVIWIQALRGVAGT